MQNHKISAQFSIMKRHEEQRIAFGWAYQCTDAAGNQMVDRSGDMIKPETLEKAAYRFVELYREGSDNHERGGVGVMVESMMFTPEKTKALGIPDGILPTGWWVGFRVLDDDVWQKVKERHNLRMERSRDRLQAEMWKTQGSSPQQQVHGRSDRLAEAPHQITGNAV